MENEKVPLVKSKELRSIDRRQFLRIAAGGAAAIATGSLIGCGGGSNGGGSGGGGTITDARRLAVLASVSAKMEALTGADADSRRLEMLTFIQSIPEFEASGETGDGSLWARFTDGRLFMLIANQDLPADRAALHQRAPVTRAGPAELPGTVKASALNCRVHLLSDPVPAVRNLLSDAGYALTALAGSIDDLKAVSGEGVLYIAAHGGIGTDVNGNDIFCFTSITTVSPANEARYAVDMTLGNLAYCLVSDYGYIFTSRVSYYAITSGFVRRYMSLGPNSFVLVDACSSNGTSANNIREAFFDKNASVYAGWTTPPFFDGALKADHYVFDRLLGANSEGPPETPDQRAFDYEALAADMSRKGLDTSNRAKFVFTKGGPDFGLLAPSIKYMDVDEHNDTLILTGKFGSAQGRVEVDGSNRPVLFWGKEKIEVRIPRTGAGSSGVAQVFVGDRESNRRNLSEWRLTFDVSQKGEESQIWQGPLNIHFRADVGSYREKPGDAPVFRASVPFRASADTRGNWVASGRKTIPGPPEKWVDWRGSSNLVNGEFAQSATNAILCFGVFSPRVRRIRIALVAFSTQFMRIVTSDGVDSALVGSTGLLDGDYSTAEPLPCVDLPLTNDFAIPGDSREEDRSGFLLKMIWQTSTPNNPPNDDDARSAKVGQRSGRT